MYYCKGKYKLLRTCLSFNLLKLKKKIVIISKTTKQYRIQLFNFQKLKAEKDSDFVGKLRGNFLAKQFNIYDGGSKENTTNKRKQLGYIEFKQDSIFGTGSEKIQILLPRPMISQKQKDIPKFLPYSFIPEDKQNILANQNKKKSQFVLKLTKQKFGSLFQHKIDDQSIQQTFSNLLNKNHKVTNIKFFEENNQQKVLFFKERSKNTFELYIGWPLNIIQGFGIALSLIQRIKSD